MCVCFLQASALSCKRHICQQPNMLVEAEAFSHHLSNFEDAVRTYHRRVQGEQIQTFDVPMYADTVLRVAFGWCIWVPCKLPRVPEPRSADGGLHPPPRPLGSFEGVAGGVGVAGSGVHLYLHDVKLCVKLVVLGCGAGLVLWMLLKQLAALACGKCITNASSRCRW